MVLFVGLMPLISFGQTFVGPGTDWNTASNWSTSAVPNTAISGTIINTNCVLTNNLTVKNGGKLIVNYPATLTVGIASNSATTEVLDFQNGSTVNVDFGASLVVLGLMNNSNNSKGITFNGTVSVTGNVTAGNGSVIDGSGSLFATGSIVSDKSTILGTTNDCNSGPCNINGSCSFTTSITGNQTVCSNTIPATLKGSTNASSPTYQWQSASSSGGGFSNISGANGIDYTFYSSLTQTTYYRLQVTSGGCTTTTTQVAVTVNPTPTLTGLSQASVLCAGYGTTINLTGLLPNSTSTISYNIGGVPQTPVSVVANATGLGSFTSPVLNSNQYFQTTSVTTTNVTPNCTSGIYVENTITVRPVFTAGGIEPAGGDLICYNTIPTKTIGSNPNASGGDGNITYQWQYSTDNTFATGVTTLAINTSTYKPTQVLTQTTYYRRQAKDGACNTTFTTSSGVFKVTVNPELFITLGANPQVTQLATQGSLPYTANNGSEFDILFTDPVAIAAGFVNLHGNLSGSSGKITFNVPYCVLPGVYNASIRVITNTPSCSSLNFPFTITVNPNTVYGGTLSSSQTICSGTTPSDLVLTSFQGSVVKWQKATDAAFTSPVDIPSSAGITTLTGAMIGNLTQNTYFRAITNYSCNRTSSNSVLVAVRPIEVPTVGTVTQPTCAVPTGSFTITNYNSSYTYSVAPSTGVIVNGDKVTVPAGTYTITATSVSCGSASSNVVINNPPNTKTWNGTNWLLDNGSITTVPTIENPIIFNGDFTSTADVEGCSCTVNPGKNVVFKSVGLNAGHTLKITNEVKILGTGTLTFENNASLVQTKDAAPNVNINSGNINYHRYTDYVRRYDFTYWSSPVEEQTLYKLSPNTLGDKYYGFDAVGNKWVIHGNGNKVMVPGEGYIIRAPQNFSITTSAIDDKPVFIGRPNNGVITKDLVAGKLYLLGNPYPSALDADKFLDTNSAVLEGTLYFWTHNTAIQLATNITNGTAGSGVYAYTSDDYASYNRTGGVSTAISAISDPKHSVNGFDLGLKPTGKIAAGQGFFAPAKDGGKLIFNNGMRVSGVNGNNSQFFKLSTTSKSTATTIERNRVWLNLTNKEGAFKQTLVGYITGATNDYDNGFDGASFDGNAFVDFYSVSQGTNLTIQGRALPFDATDSVPLGYRSTIKGSFSISIDDVDGTMQSQNVYLEDKVLSVVHNLKGAPYTFTTDAGTYDDRFVLRYTDRTLGNVDFDKTNNQVSISKDKNDLKIKSEIETIKQITVFDLLGKKVFEKEAVNSNEFSSSSTGLSKQVGIVKVTLANGQVISKKVVF